MVGLFILARDLPIAVTVNEGIFKGSGSVDRSRILEIYIFLQKNILIIFLFLKKNTNSFKSNIFQVNLVPQSATVVQNSARGKSSPIRPAATSSTQVSSAYIQNNPLPSRFEIKLSLRYADWKYAKNLYFPDFLDFSCPILNAFNIQRKSGTP